MLKAHNDYFYDGSSPYNGGEENVQHIIQFVQEFGLKYLKHGVSYKPASNSRKYTWYIRLLDNQDNVAQYQDLKKQGFFSRLEALPEFLVSNQKAQELQEKLSQYEQLWQQEQARVGQQLANALENWELEKLNTEDKVKESDTLKELLHLYEKEVEGLRHQQKTQQNEMYQIQYESELALQEAINRNEAINHNLSRQTVDVEKLILQLFSPEIEFLCRLEYLLIDYVDITDAISFVKKIASGEQLGKRFQDSDGWYEITKVQTGHDDSGRIYYRCCESGKSYQLYISVKSLQKLDAKRLKDFLC
jgi:hypothetical protein